MLQPDDLKQAFPWLGTDEEVSGADVVDQVTEAYERALEAEKEQNKLRRKYLAAAEAEEREGELEVDDNAIVSWGDNAGAYVACWMWVSDKEAKAANKLAREERKAAKR